MITETDAEGLLRYLIGLRAVTATQDQPAAWMDYINYALPDLKPMDMLPAARLAVDQWAGEGRKWQIDAARYVRAVRHLWGLRRQTYRALHAGRPGHGINGAPQPEGDLTGDQYAAWVQAASRAIREGVTSSHEVLSRAYLAIGRDIPLELEGVDQ